MIHFENDRVAYHIEREFRRGRSKLGVWGYLSTKNFLPQTWKYCDLSKYYSERVLVEFKVETLFNLILEEGVGKLIYNKGKDKSPKFYFYKDYHRNNKFTTLPI